MSEAEHDDYRRNRVGFVYQSFNLIGNLSAVDNVLLPYIPLGVTPELRVEGGRPAQGGRPGAPDEPPPAGRCPAASSSAWRSPAP